MSDASHKIDMEELRTQFMGKPFHLLVEAHIKRGKSKANLWVTGQGTRQLLTPFARNLAEDFINRWIEPAYSPEFWQTDTSIVFTNIIEDARAVLVSAGVAIDDDTLFYMFQLIVLNYAYCAIDQPSMRDFMNKPPHP